MNNIANFFLVYILSTRISYWVTKKYFTEESTLELNVKNKKDVRGGVVDFIDGILLLIKDRSVKLSINSLFSTIMV